ncbi:MAG: hypothetical protein RMN25_07700, partial [Anaerolineae bacterium]|nr:hypothetical protein [Thermoflexales bacterium]MDW8407655.1 hypothetical protein [Anaerolineae bacterium]
MRRNQLISLLAGGVLCVALLGSANAQSPDPGGASASPVEARTEGESGTNSDAGPAAPDVMASSAFAYQGQLKLNGVLVNDTCDMAFRLYDAAAAGNQVGSAISMTLGVNNGLFTTALNFGTSPFDGEANWIEVRVRCPSGSGSFTTLSPRQQILAAPYALTLRPGATISATGSGSSLINVQNY